MGISVELFKIKEKEDSTCASYLYRSAGTQQDFGEININKSTGDVSLERNAEGDESEALARRASWALLKCFKKGEFPDKTWWQ